MSVLSTFSESFLHFVLIFRIAAVSTEKKYLIPNVFSHPFPSIEIRIETVRAFWCRSNLSGLKTILDVKRRKQVFKIVFQTGASLQISGFLSKFFFYFFKLLSMGNSPIKMKKHLDNLDKLYSVPLESERLLFSVIF